MDSIKKHLETLHQQFKISAGFVINLLQIQISYDTKLADSKAADRTQTLMPLDTVFLDPANCDMSQ